VAGLLGKLANIGRAKHNKKNDEMTRSVKSHESWRGSVFWTRELRTQSCRQK